MEKEYPMSNIAIDIIGAVVRKALGLLFNYNFLVYLIQHSVSTDRMYKLFRKY